MEFLKFSDEGRTLLIEFKCMRCKKTHIENLEQVVDESSDSYGHLSNMRLPKGWKKISYYGTILCEDCTAKFDKFMCNEAVE